MRTLSAADKLICEVDRVLQTIFIPKQRQSKRPSPAATLSEADMSPAQKAHVAGLMRVNHAGEVCAQALYQGQACTATLATIKAQMTQAAEEEIDHLAWCEQRLDELGSHPSVLNIYWYLGSFFIGAAAGLLGDQWSLGFVAETERQVCAHLEKHLQNLPIQDQKTHAILEQMHTDENHHARIAINAGAATLPWIIKQGMRISSKCLTWGSYRL